MQTESERKQSIDNSLTDQNLPIPIQIFLWKQVSPFIRPKLGKLHEASCVFCQHAPPGHHELKESCKTFEKVLVQNNQFGLKPDVTEAIKSIPRWRLVQASLPHVMHCSAALLYNRMKDGNIQTLGAVETKLLYTLHWIILDAAEECADADYEKGVFHSSPFYYLFSIPTITLFIYLFAPVSHHLKESDFQNFRLENGLKIWQAMWEFRHPEAFCFTTHCKPKPKNILGKNMKNRLPQFGDVFLGRTHMTDGIEPIIMNETGRDWPINYVFQRDSQGLWTANIMDVVKSKSEVAMCGQWQMGRSPGDVETTYPYTDMCATFLAPKPYLVTQISFVFQPLHPTTWVLCAFITLTIGTIWYFSAEVYWKLGKKLEAESYRDYIKCVLNSIRIFFLVSLEPFPRETQIVFRYIVVSWFITCLMVSCGYSSGFTSTLTYPRYTKPINTISDMLEADLWWGSMETDTYDVYATSYNQDLLNFVKKFKKEKSWEEKNSRIKTKNYVITCNSLPSKYVTDVEELDEYAKENLRILPSCAGRYQVILGLKKNSQFLDIINWHLFAFAETGHVDHWYTQLIRRYNMSWMFNVYRSYTEPLANENIVLDLQKFVAVFMFLIAGYIVAFVLFLLETTKFHPGNRIKTL